MRLNKFVYLLCGAAICISLSMAACERLASTPPIPSETPDLLNILSTNANTTQTPLTITPASTNGTPQATPATTEATLMATDTTPSGTDVTILATDASIDTTLTVEPGITATDQAKSVKTAVPTVKATSNNSPYMGQHTVMSGETLYMIGRAYGVYPAAIADANHIADPNSITPGMVLNIPKVRWPGGVPQGPTAKTQFEPNF